MASFKFSPSSQGPFKEEVIVSPMAGFLCKEGLWFVKYY